MQDYQQEIFNNFYAFFEGATKCQVKELFRRCGWQIRKESWHDFEIINTWAEFILQGDEGKPLLNGTIIHNKRNLEVLDNILCNLSGAYSYEIYGDDKNILVVKHSNGY